MPIEIPTTVRHAHCLRRPGGRDRNRPQALPVALPVALPDPLTDQSRARLTARLAGLLAAALSVASPATMAQQDYDEIERPLWEVGLGIGGISFPHYRGSDERVMYVFPTPYLVYRGRFLRADRDGLRGRLFDSDRAELNISLGLSLPVKSRDNDAREGMPNLKTSVELGPSLNLNLWQSGTDRSKLDLRLPVRLAVTLESSPRAIGWIFSPNLHLDIADVAGFRGWNLGMTAGPLFATSRYHQYYYAVDQQFATAARPAYSASGGYSGSMALVSLSRRFRHVWVGAFVRYDRLDGATFADSPLVRQKGALAGGLAVTWVFGQSSTMVRSRE